MSTLTKSEIKHRLKGIDSARQLFITPMLSRRQVNGASVDVRLGNQFIVFRAHTFGAFDKRELDGILGEAQERLVVPFGSSFVLHPGALVLAATFEYFSIPSDLECQIEGRSSWARVGLQIATATTVEPLFQGVVTLELSNVGAIPLRLHPGVRIGQAVFRNAHPPVEQSEGVGRKYHGAIGPDFSRIHEDEDLQIFSNSPVY